MESKQYMTHLVYDMVDGQLDRNAAYNFAGDSVEAALKKNPSVKVVIDLHRDSVESSIHLRTKINGESTAQIMFFNGVSRLAKKGDIGYLYNPNKKAIWHLVYKCSFYVGNIIQT